MRCLSGSGGTTQAGKSFVRCSLKNEKSRYRRRHDGVVVVKLGKSVYGEAKRAGRGGERGYFGGYEIGDVGVLGVCELLDGVVDGGEEKALPLGLVRVAVVGGALSKAGAGCRRRVGGGSLPSDAVEDLRLHLAAARDSPMVFGPPAPAPPVSCFIF